MLARRTRLRLSLEINASDSALMPARSAVLAADLELLLEFALVGHLLHKLDVGALELLLLDADHVAEQLVLESLWRDLRAEGGGWVGGWVGSVKRDVRSLLCSSTLACPMSV